MSTSWTCTIHLTADDEAVRDWLIFEGYISEEDKDFVITDDERRNYIFDCLENIGCDTDITYDYESVKKED